VLHVRGSDCCVLQLAPAGRCRLSPRQAPYPPFHRCPPKRGEAQPSAAAAAPPRHQVRPRAQTWLMCRG